MSLAIAQALGMAPKPRPAEAPSRVVLNMSLAPVQIQGSRRSSDQVMRERALVYAAVSTLHNPTRDDIARDTGLDAEIVTARLNWLSTHGIAVCWRSRQTAIWKLNERTP